MSTKDTVQIALLGLVAWLVYTALKKFQGAADVVTAPVARAWVELTTGPRPQVLGQVKLPNGQTVTMNQIVSAGGRVTGDGTFRWDMVTYQITGRDASGSYVARRIVT